MAKWELGSMFLASLSETSRIAQKLAACLVPGDCLLLYGDVGAGKTTFMRALIQAMSAGCVGEVVSPSFMIMQEYEVVAKGQRAMLCHIDGYRIVAAEEIYELGIEEIAGEAILCIEWPEKFDEFLPESRLALTITINENQTRTLTFQPYGTWVGRLAGFECEKRE